MQNDLKIKLIQFEKRNQLGVELGLPMLNIIDINQLFVRLHGARQKLESGQKRGFGGPGSSQANLDLAGQEQSERRQWIILGYCRQLGERLFVAL